MHEDVGTTPRKPLTPKQRLALFERHQGICCLCHRQITGRDWIDEHMRALGLGGGNEPENRGIAHIACADLKTHGPGGDKEMTDRAKRVKRKELGIKGRPTPLTGPTRDQLDARKDRRSKDKGRDGRLPRLEPRSLFVKVR